MEEPNISFYFKRLRMIYCREQQIIGLLPELATEAERSDLREAIRGYLAAARCRRYMIKDLAGSYGISPLGDECLAMRKLIAVGRARLAAESRGTPHDPAVENFCHEVHRVVMVDYSLTRYLAVELGLQADLRCFDEVLEALVDAFPKIGGHPPRPAAGHPAEHALL